MTLSKICDGNFLRKLWTTIKKLDYSCFRISRPEVFCKKDVLRNFAKFTGKHLCQSLCFNKVRPATLLKMRLWNRCFPVNFAKFLRTHFFIEHLWWLLLIFDMFLKYVTVKRTTKVHIQPVTWSTIAIVQKQPFADVLPNGCS